MKYISNKALLSLSIFTTILVVFLACAKKDDKSLDSTQSTDSTFSGQLSALSVSSLSTLDNGIKFYTTKTITHVMAVSPSTGASERFVTTVDTAGNFTLPVSSGKPYLIVFISKDASLTGPDMIVSTVKISANDLDTLAPTTAANIDLGTVTPNSSTSEATISTSVTDLLTNLGLSAAEATFLGGIDDLALRLANPDVDMNGEIDSLENKNFGMDWHVRASTQLNGSDLRVSDITDKYADASGGTISVNWTLASGYAVYPSSFDNIDYVGASSGVSTVLQNGGVFASTGGTIDHTSVSGGQFSSSRQWGPDYNMQTQEIAGSDAATTFTYTLGSSSKQLKYSNVRTKTKAQLNADGILLPFVKINTTNGLITGITYKWMKRTGSAWVAATTTEVTILVQSGGAYWSLYTEKGSGVENGLFFTIPANPETGTINIGETNFSSQGVSNTSTVTPDSVCSSALSYDDKMGLRLFAGAPKANTGVTECN